MTEFTDRDQLWLFGYGSLIFKADFDFLERRSATIKDWERRFWQGSHDHRGTEEAPGRVATLVSKQGAICHGMAYLVSTDALDHLDFREKNGYLRFETEMQFSDETTTQGLVYIATADNTAYLGPASEKQIADHISSSFGPSGSNSEYLLKLADALRSLHADDPHVFEIEEYLRRI